MGSWNLPTESAVPSELLTKASKGMIGVTAKGIAFYLNNQTGNTSFLLANSERGTAEVTIAHRKREADSRLIVVMETLKDCSAKPTILCSFQ